MELQHYTYFSRPRFSLNQCSNCRSDQFRKSRFVWPADPNLNAHTHKIQAQARRLHTHLLEEILSTVYPSLRGSWGDTEREREKQFIKPLQHWIHTVTFAEPCLGYPVSWRSTAVLTFLSLCRTSPFLRVLNLAQQSSPFTFRMCFFVPLFPPLHLSNPKINSCIWEAIKYEQHFIFRQAIAFRNTGLNLCL